ncbi:radical SAM family heme chaperone HemW [Pseudoprimorskyibacter insulae]|uniref:Heme chaperone HemW n=1 Tax=Pseudoprimorskyibacter insulae TaxID=1695997 RepID=A0A2R8ATR2_9RHOB|nr:radical SAM family heme chaperone HemW [Pseudoprimorskyibacter insulae]SPF79452.1 Oxygen-independent coproporphyrinogen-III oxidase-like protein YqeR [Pseudoprimorskyibacter insulae]
MRSANSWQAALIEDWRNGGFGLYLHWPFCEAKCPYCDFNSHVSRQIDQTAWQVAYLSEIERVGALTKDRVLNSVFFGGGTPSLMNPDLVDAILEKIRDTWTLANDLEVTLEANPGSVEAGRFKAYSEAGVNRVSMGFQALNNRDLRRLGRIHTVEEGRRAFDIARSTFKRVSFDLIYARQEQAPEDWRAELTEALNMAVDHLSLYQLTIEQGTAFGDRYNAGKLRDLPNDDAAAEMYEITQEVCDAFGMPAYEVSNHARPDAESRHNMIYWRYGDYAGIGPGAHGRLTLNGKKHATEAFRQPNLWLERALGGNGDSVVGALTPQDMAGEYLIMGMRINDGIDVTRFEALAGQSINQDGLRDLLDWGMVTATPNEISTTRAGRMVLNAVIEKLMPDQ